MTNTNGAAEFVTLHTGAQNVHIKLIF